MRDSQRIGGDVQVGHEPQTVCTDRDRRPVVRKAGPDPGVEGGRGRARARKVVAVGDRQLLVRPVHVADQPQTVGTDRDGAAVADVSAAVERRDRGRAGSPPETSWPGYSAHASPTWLPRIAGRLR